MNRLLGKIYAYGLLEAGVNIPTTLLEIKKITWILQSQQ
jgi:hypothetical protein